MAKAKDITGNRYDKLLVTSKDEEATVERRMAYWYCKCDCGTVISYRGANLKNGNTKSCGCSHPNKLPYGQSSRNALLYRYKKGAQDRGFEWSLTDEQAYRLFESPCSYCGVTAHERQFRNSKEVNGSYGCTGIDRMDNSIGYTYGNVVSCCPPCNFAKRSTSYAEWVSWIKRVASYHAQLAA